MRSICCDSPGNRKLSRNIRNPTNRPFPRKSNEATYDSNTSRWKESAFPKYSPIFRLSNKVADLRNRATSLAFGGSEKMPKENKRIVITTMRKRGEASLVACIKTSNSSGDLKTTQSQIRTSMSIILLLHRKMLQNDSDETTEQMSILKSWRMGTIEFDFFIDLE